MINKSTGSIKGGAPALERGIHLLNILASGQGDRNLDELAKITKYPKASILRFLETLANLGLVRKDPRTRTYHAVAALVPMRPDDIYMKHEISSVLEKLSSDTGKTSEWYIPHNGNMTISDRHEVQNGPVQVKATIGFVRDPDEEFEAVARIALANGIGNAGRKEFWRTRGAEKIKVPAEKAYKILSASRKNGIAMDEDFNANGVRRFAASVKDGQGDLFGTLALADIFIPSHDADSRKILNTLRDTADELESKINLKYERSTL